MGATIFDDCASKYMMYIMVSSRKLTKWELEVDFILKFSMEIRTLWN